MALSLGAGILCTTTTQAQLADGLLNYWPLDGDATDAAASTVGAAGTSADDGNVNGTVTFIDNATANLGAGFGMAGSFPGGAGNNITIEDPDGATNDIDRSGADLTISAWFLLNTRDTGWQALIAHGEGTDYRVAVRGTDNPIPMSYAGGGAASDIVSSTTVGDGPAGDATWHHIAVTTAGSVTQIFIDGVLEATGGTGPINENGQNRLCIGCNPTNGREWNGLIDDVGMWNRALSEAEVKLIYDEGVLGNALSSLFVVGDDDDDGLPNAWEELYGLDPNDDGTGDINNGPDGDPDMDNVTNIDEFTNGTFPNDDDSDDDTLLDGVETNTDTYNGPTDTGTNPLEPDSDGDGLDDNVEDNGGIYVSETQTGSNPNVADTDFDTMPDGYEVNNMQNPNVDDGGLDPDTDDLTNLAEFGLGTDPRDDDTDDDLVKDGDEGTLGTDPLDNDSDDDTLLDGYETNDGNFVSAEQTGTDPLTTDYDSDGTHDGAEVLGSRDPTNANDALGEGLNQKLVAYWNFDNNLDDIAHNLTSESMVADTGEFTGPDTDVFYATEGLYGSSALEQNGGAGWVTVPSSVDTLRGIDNAVSVSAWVKLNTFDVNWQAIISHGEGAQWRMARNNNTAGVAWAGGAPDIGGGDVADGQWHHVVGVSDPVNFSTAIYVDGVQVTTGGAPTISDVNGGIVPDLFIGANPQGANREWNGQIDDLAIWGRGLSQEEVTEIFNAGVSLEDLLGGGIQLAITETSFNPDIGADGQYTVTFTSREGASYGLFYSTDLVDFGADIDDNVAGADGTTTVTFANPAPGSSRIFFRVQAN